MTKLTQRKRGDNVQTVSFQDVILAQGGIVVDNTAYDPNKDRIYNSKGLETIFIKLINEGAVTLTYIIDATQVEFTSLNNLSDADFTKILEVEGTIGAGLNTEFTEDVMGPEITAVRIRTKAATPTTLGGIVSAD